MNHSSAGQLKQKLKPQNTYCRFPIPNFSKIYLTVLEMDQMDGQVDQQTWIPHYSFISCRESIMIP